MIFLCHKCSGSHECPPEPGLYTCGCISGYYRGFEPAHTLESAIAEQERARIDREALRASQARAQAAYAERKAKASPGEFVSYFA